MSEIKVEKIDEKRLKEMGVKFWPIWEKEPSSFPWEYTETETCYFLEGKVKVTTEDGRDFEIGKGDLVIFPKGLKCNWNVIEKVRKHYSFG